jgi:hypothetical protein
MNVVDEPITRPKAVDSAFQAMLASVGVSAVGTVVNFLLNKALLTSWVTETMDSLPPDQRLPPASMVGALQVLLGFSIAIFAGLFVLFATKMRAGRNWARVVLTIFTATSVWGFLTAVATSGAELSLIWSLAEALFGVTAVIYMFRPESTKYFADVKERRLRSRQRP